MTRPSKPNISMKRPYITPLGRPFKTIEIIGFQNSQIFPLFTKCCAESGSRKKNGHMPKSVHFCKKLFVTPGLLN